MKESNILGNHDNDLLYSGEGSMLSEDLLKRYGFKYGQQVGIGRALEKAISKGFFQLSDAEDSRYLSFFHAGLEKTNSVECIEQILIDNQIDVPEELYRRKECRIVGRPVIYEKGKRLELEPIDIRMKVADIRSEDLYRIREDNGIGPECISEFINNKFKTDVISDYSKGEKFLYHKKKEREKQRLYANGKANVDDTFFSTAITDAGRIPPVVLENTPKVTFNNVPVYCIPFKLTATGIMDTRKKMFREYLKNEGSNYDPQNIKPHKEISVNGHEPTFFFKSFFPGERAIQRKGNNIFADFGGGYETYTGSQNGKRDRKGMQGVGFVAVDKDTIFSIEFDHIAKEWRKYELAKLPSREVRAKRLKRIEEGHRANSIKKFMIQFEI